MNNEQRSGLGPAARTHGAPARVIEGAKALRLRLDLHGELTADVGRRALLAFHNHMAEELKQQAVEEPSIARRTPNGGGPQSAGSNAGWALRFGPAHVGEERDRATVRLLGMAAAGLADLLPSISPRGPWLDEYTGGNEQQRQLQALFERVFLTGGAFAAAPFSVVCPTTGAPLFEIAQDAAGFATLTLLRPDGTVALCLGGEERPQPVAAASNGKQKQPALTGRRR